MGLYLKQYIVSRADGRGMRARARAHKQRVLERRRDGLDLCCPGL